MIVFFMSLCFFLSMSCVLAEDVNETGNFTELDTLINDADGDVNLASNYSYVDGDADVVISKSVKINGNDYIIDNTESPIYIDANNSEITFERINFLNHKFMVSNGTHSLNLTFVDCNFTYMDNASCTPIKIYPSEVHTTGKISSTVIQLAKSIVGDSTDIDAAYKLAKWVGTNIKHETADGFYQTPDTTISRGLGNCCSQTDLFLQMCVAIGLDKNHKLYFVHVGTMKFGQRHFFAMIDNLLVDVDSMPNSPWGHAYLGSYGFNRVVEYPNLPLLREY